MYRRDDPRLRRTLDQLSHNVESATEHAQENLYTFSQHYINPCLSSISNCFRSCTEACCPGTEERKRRTRTRSQGRAEYNFDFYDDWEEDENEALLGWGNGSDSLDRLLAGSGDNGSGSSAVVQPNRERAMSYGTRRAENRTRRKSAAPLEDEPEENVIQGSNYLGFLERLPWRMGRKVLRYRPSAADLQEHPGAWSPARPENEPLMEDSDEEFSSPFHNHRGKDKHRRNRSLTQTSGHTTDSLSSRGDLFPSEDEADDAVPLDDEFAYILERRSTGEDTGSRPRANKSNSRLSTRTVSSKSLGSRKSSRQPSGSQQQQQPPTFSELKAEEEQVQAEEEADVARRREAAQRLAITRGLSSGTTSVSHAKSETSHSSPRPEMTDVASKSPSISGAIPVPAFDVSAPETPAPEDLDIGANASISTGEQPPEEAVDNDFTPAALPHFVRSEQPG